MRTMITVGWLATMNMRLMLYSGLASKASYTFFVLCLNRSLLAIMLVFVDPLVSPVAKG